MKTPVKEKRALVEQLRQYFEERHVTKRQLGFMGLDWRTVYKWLHGDRLPVEGNVHLIRRLLGHRRPPAILEGKTNGTSSS